MPEYGLPTCLASAERRIAPREPALPGPRSRRGACFTRYVNWHHRKPDGVGEIEITSDGFTAPIAIPPDEEGYFGRECPSCTGLFKMRKDEYKALPDELELTCPYCGHREDHGAFLSTAQRERVMAAAKGLAYQFVHAQVNDMLSSTFGSRRSTSRSPIGVNISYQPGSPPPIMALPEIAEDRTRLIIHCAACTNHHAVYSATAFCPVCGPRPAAETVLEAIRAAKDALAIEDRLPEDERETLRAAGVFERIAIDSVKSDVSLFEQFASAQFAQRVATAADLTKGKGNVFQRLDDTAKLFRDHARLDLPRLAGDDRWQRLHKTFAQRHVLTHNGGIVDAKFVAQVPDTSFHEGQRLIISRDDAETALDDLSALVTTILQQP